MTFSKIVPILLLTFSSLFAFNHPELEWKSVSTNHFIIHYYPKTEGAVYATWKIAEEAYASLSKLYDYETLTKINIALADYDDYSNGYASWTNGCIMIWVTDNRFELRGNNTWLRNVITHELAHIISLEKTAKPQLLDYVLGFEYTSNKNTLALYEPFALSRFWPQWLAEGIAQRESERNGNDCFDTRRQMILSDALINGKQLSLWEMSHFNHDMLGNEMVYNQGYSFVTYLEKNFGVSLLKQLMNSGRKTQLVANSFEGLFKEQTGQNIENVYAMWLESEKQAATATLPKAATSVSVVWKKGFINTQPRVSKDGKYWGWLTSNNDDAGRTDLVIASYGSTEPLFTLERALLSWDFSHDSKKVFFIKAYETSDNGSFYNDLYELDIEKHQTKRLTRGARLYDIATCPDNISIAAVQNNDGVFSIIRMTTNGKNRETLYKGILGEPFSGLSFSPAMTGFPAQTTTHTVGTLDSIGDTVKIDTLKQTKFSPPEYKLATSILLKGKAVLCVLGYNSRKLSIIGNGTANEESPHWAHDDHIYYSADYDGIYNIYSIDVSDKSFLRHTNAMFGMFSPYNDNKGNLLASSYSSGAFAVVSCNEILKQSFTPQTVEACSFSDLPRPKGEVSINAKPYEAKLLRPVWSMQTVFLVDDQYALFDKISNSFSFNQWLDTASVTAVASVQKVSSDALGKVNFSMGLDIAAVHEGLKRDTVSTNSILPQQNDRALQQNVFFNDNPDNKRIAYAAKNMQSNYLYFMQNKALRSYAENKLSATDTSADSSQKAGSWGSILQPYVSYGNARHEISYGGDIKVIVIQFLPIFFNITANSEWHVARDFYLSLSPYVSIIPLASFLVPDTRLTVGCTYLNSNYMNTDLQYNLGGITQLQLFYQGENFIPSNNAKTIDELAAIKRVSAHNLLFEGRKGFSLSKYSSVVAKASCFYQNYSEPVKDVFHNLPYGSTEYIFSSLGASFMLPVFRQINNGPVYSDALYAELGYDCEYEANTRDLGSNALSCFSVPGYLKNQVYVGHILSAGLKLGFYKSYLFTRSLQGKVYWDIWNAKAAFNVTVGF